jgi:DNA-binding transcriptional LysR family regulator
MFIRQLEYLVALAREKHFARAAEVCHVSQPALSAGIRHLEEELGVSIVQRGQRYMGISKEGERILEWAKQTLSAWEGLRQEASIAKADLSGTLRVGAIPTTVSIAPFITGPIRSAFPHVHQLLKSASAEEIMRGLDDFDLDLGLTYLEDQRLEGFKVWPLFRERYVLLARDAALVGQRSEITWAEAAKFPLCLLTTNMQNRRIIGAAFRRAKAQPNIVIETNSMFALYSHVLCSAIVTIVPHSLLALPGIGRDLLAIPLVPELHRAIGLIGLDQDPLPPMVAAAWAITHTLDLPTLFASLIAPGYQSIGANT